jgi:sterol 3beta-glucosyltransferase
MIGDNPVEMTEVVLKALRLAGRRAVLITGWGGLTNADMPDDVFKIERVPYDWLFPQTAAFVHHAGVGTLALGLRAGIPTVTVPFTRDELYWGWQVAGMRVGPAPILRTQLTAERLATAICCATSDAGMRDRVAALSRRIQAEDGVARAVDAFHQYLS